MLRLTIISILTVIAMTSCEKIIAEDISGQVPTVILPNVNDTVESNPVHFKWDELSGASKYRLMVVSPSFSTISSYALDTLISGTNFYYSLDSNEYEMKLIASNAGYTSDTTGPIKFWVGVQPSSTGSSVTLNTPSNAVYVNGSFNNQFSWNSLISATSYEISIRSGSNFSTGTILDGLNNIATTIYTSPIAFTEGEYTWGVKAYLGSIETLYSINTLYVDETAPNNATLSMPGNLSTVSQGVVNFSWSNGTDPGTIHAPVNSLIEIATDSGFTNIVQSNIIQGTSTSYNLASGTYYWRVTNYDDAGNYSGVSATNQFSAL